MRATFKFRVERQGKRKVIEVRRPREGPLEGKKERFVHPVARRLALAYFIEDCVASGRVESYAEMARRLGISRARMSQVMDLMLLPPRTQERIIRGENRPSREQIKACIRARSPRI